MYAIVLTGGKQIKVAVGDKVFIEKVVPTEDGTVVLDNVLLLGGDKTVVGTPYVSGAKVVAKLLKTDKHRKVVVFRYHSKANVRVKRGHRQPYSLVEIVSIEA